MVTATDLAGVGVAPAAARRIGDVLLNSQTAAGSSASDALALGQATIVNFTTVGSNTGAILPSADLHEKGSVVIRNNGSNPLTVYPYGSETINGTTSFTVTNAKGAHIYRIATGAWIAMLSG